MKTPVLAQDMHSYQKFLESKGLDPKHFKYVYLEESIRGVRGLVLAVGDYWRNPAYTAKFHEYLKCQVKAGHVSVLKGLPRD